MSNQNLFSALRAAFPSDLDSTAVETTAADGSPLFYTWRDLDRASARRIAALAPGAARMNKQVLRALKTPPALDGKAPAAIEMIVNGPHDPYAYADSAEHREGITAFLAKRPPVF